MLRPYKERAIWKRVCVAPPVVARLVDYIEGT
jgi:hypothetical protein